MSSSIKPTLYVASSVHSGGRKIDGVGVGAGTTTPDVTATVAVAA